MKSTKCFSPLLTAEVSTEFKLEMVKLIEEQNQLIVDAAKQYDIGKSTLENWLKRYRLELQGKPLPTGHALTPEQQELERLRKENAQLRLERDILKMAYTIRFKPSDVLFHSDQGTYYTSRAFADVVARCKMTHSMSKKGNY